MIKYLLATFEYVVGSITIFCILRYIVNDSSVFFCFIHTPIYHKIHPISFIMVSSLSFFLSLVCVSLMCKYLKKVYLYLIFYLFWLFISCILAGILWSHYDMKAGWIPQGTLFYKKNFEDITNGILYGPWMILLSFPYNIFITTLSFYILKINKIFTSYETNRTR